MTDLLDSGSCAVANTKISLFKDRWQDSDPARSTGRTQTRLTKGTDAIKAFFTLLCLRTVNKNLPIANLGVAAYGMVKGGRDFAPDFRYSGSVRYMFSGDRSVVVAPLTALVAFTKKSRWITGDGDSGKGSFD